MHSENKEKPLLEHVLSYLLSFIRAVLSLFVGVFVLTTITTVITSDYPIDCSSMSISMIVSDFNCLDNNAPLTFCEYSERYCNPTFILADSPMYSTLAVFFVIWLSGTLTAFYIVIRSYLVRRREFKEDLKQIDEMIANSDAIDTELEALQKSLEKQHEKLLKIQRAARLSVNSKVQPDA